MPDTNNYHIEHWMLENTTGTHSKFYEIVKVWWPAGGSGIGHVGNMYTRYGRIGASGSFNRELTGSSKLKLDTTADTRLYEKKNKKGYIQTKHGVTVASLSAGMQGQLKASGFTEDLFNNTAQTVEISKKDVLDDHRFASIE